MGLRYKSQKTQDLSLVEISANKLLITRFFQVLIKTICQHFEQQKIVIEGIIPELNITTMICISVLYMNTEYGKENGR